VNSKVIIAVAALFMTSCDVSASQNSGSSGGGSDIRIDDSKWGPAQSQEGRFSIDLPCAANSQDTAIYRTNAQIKQHALGCRRTDGVAFSAVRVSYVDSAVGQNDFDRLAKPMRKGDAPAQLVSYEGFQAIERSNQSYGICEHMLIVRVGNDNFLLGLQSLNHSPCEKYATDAQRFFGSLKVFS
jgi:hypothetical protein